jgi:hypothetical protein
MTTPGVSIYGIVHKAFMSNIERGEKCVQIGLKKKQDIPFSPDPLNKKILTGFSRDSPRTVVCSYIRFNLFHVLQCAENGFAQMEFFCKIYVCGLALKNSKAERLKKGAPRTLSKT